MEVDPFVLLTEVAGAPISGEQLQRMVNRYAWARPYCVGKDVLEVACGSGQGLNLLGAAAKSLTAGDFSMPLLEIASRTGTRAPLVQLDAQTLPFGNSSFDVVVIFEALYYVPDPNRFFAEAARVLRPDGCLLIATANRDLYDFNPSPHSHLYFSADQLASRLSEHGFTASLFGDHPIEKASMRQRILRPAKAIAVRAGIFPKTASGKVWLKRLVFGEMVEMPASIREDTRPYQRPSPISSSAPDYRHKVLLCAGTKRKG